jgi:DNA-binding GntR family transcriptional regulator
MLIETARIESKTLRQQIVSQIRDALLRGLVKPGEKIVERELAAQFNVSLTVVREAIVQLEAEGIVVKRPNASTAIVQLSTRDILDIFAVRRELERYAFMEAARQISDEEFHELEALHQQAVDVAKAGDGDAYVQADLAWHQAVWRVAKNSFLEAALQRVIIPLFGFSYIQLASSAAFDLQEDARSHEKLLDALRHKNPRQAEKAFAEAAEIWMEYALELDSSA